MRRIALLATSLVAVVVAVVVIVATTSSRDEPARVVARAQGADPNTSTSESSCDEVMDPYFETPQFALLHPELAEQQASHDGALC
jgi:hypothetical protein